MLATIGIKIIQIIQCMKRTTVSINEETKEQLAKFGRKGESFDIILQRVMSNTHSLCHSSEKDDVVEEEQ